MILKQPCQVSLEAREWLVLWGWMMGVRPDGPPQRVGEILAKISEQLAEIDA
jgi:hypothetical protein